MKTELHLLLDLVSIREIRRYKEDRIVKDMKLRKEPFNQLTYSLIQTNQWEDFERV